jgi:4-methylaminobutanoate oxidase (formaldehyde-forming)
VLLEQGKLTCGTTWHAGRLVGQTRATRNATRMSQYGIELYASLEQETGLATGWKQCGSLNVAKTPERLQLIKRQMARAKSFGIAFDYVSPTEAARIAPILRTTISPAPCGSRRRQGESDRSHAIAGQRARQRGAAIHEGVKVTGVRTRTGAWRASPGRAATIRRDDL